MASPSSLLQIVLAVSLLFLLWLHPAADGRPADAPEVTDGVIVGADQEQLRFIL